VSTGLLFLHPFLDEPAVLMFPFCSKRRRVDLQGGKSMRRPPGHRGAA
jgi:hypothetical protein